MAVKKIKDAKNENKLLTILRTRKFIINSNVEKNIKDFIFFTGYYKLSGYWLPYYNKQIECLNQELDFCKIKETFLFDKKIREILLELTSTIEIKFKASLINTMCVKYGPLFYYDSSFFKDSNRHKEWIDKFETNVNYSDKNDEEFKQWYKEKYNSKFPLWVTFEMVNFNDVSKLYSNLKTKYKKDICQIFNIFDIKLIDSWIRSATIIRNICAHNGRLFYRTINTSPKKIPRYKNKNIYFNQKRLFTNILVMKELLNDETEWRHTESKIIDLVMDMPNVDLIHYGFPDEWYDYLVE